MSSKRIVRYKVGDCVTDGQGIGKIEQMITDTQRRRFFEITWVVLAAEDSKDYHRGVVIRQLSIFPLFASKEFRPASEEDYAKAKKIVDMCDVSIQALLSKYREESVTK